MSESLVGRIIYVSEEGRDLFNRFYLIAEEETSTVTLVRLRTQRWFDEGPCGWERPEIPGDTVAALGACANPLTVSKTFDVEGRPLLGLPAWNCEMLYTPEWPSSEPLPEEFKNMDPDKRWKAIARCTALPLNVSICRFWNGREVPCREL
jgi:hypothetical protein